MNKLLAALIIPIAAETAMAESTLPDIDKAWNFRAPPPRATSFRERLREGEKAGDNEWLQANEPERLARLKKLAESTP